MRPQSLTELENIAQQSEQQRLRSFHNLAFELNQLANDLPVNDPEAPREPGLPTFALSEFSGHSISTVESEGSNIDQVYI